MTSPVLEARGLVRDYHVGGGLFSTARTVHAVKGVSFKVEEGKTLAIVGESGCGKSTLARIVTMIDAQTAGEFFIDGQKIDISKDPLTPELRRKVQIVFQNPYGSLNPRQKIGDVLGEPLLVNTNMPAGERRDRASLGALRRTVQIVFQNPYGSLNPRQKIGDVLGEPLLVNTSMPAGERRDRAMAMLQKVGLQPEHFNRYPHMFSGGQRQRIAIARALMLNPRLLVLDEPVSALDLSVQAQVLNLLADLQDEFQLTYVFISHDLSVVRYIADEVMVMYFGEAVEYGTRDDVFSNPEHDYTKTLFAATPRADVDSIKARLAKKKAA